MLKNFLRSSKVLHINSKKLAKRTIVNLIPEMKLVFQGHREGIIATLMINECGFEEISETATSVSVNKDQ